ncbi:serine hydrolase domain-containing protein [Desertivirga arenae]|uniref:serine hydrolase domain-containing protein n=1 Tax=Desertivirga arenae TaxID=2810309 RepID=UPI001A96D8AA|nr:serine hydrolase domain-containing protein [Pedobacter sp. SYSU D00823]
MNNKPIHIFSLLLYFLLFQCSLRANAQKVKKLDSLFNTICADSTFSGSVLVAEDGLPIYQKTMGYANLATKQAVSSQTMFELASVSKQFTAMAIMQLHDKKKLEYSDSLQKYFPKIAYPGVTIQNLLNHTSGIPEFLGWDEKRININQINYNKDILASIEKSPQALNFKPGEQLSYSNTNYVLLALIVEKVSGMAFSKYIQEKIFVPLGMNHTRVYAQRAAKSKIRDYANGYVYDAGKGTFVINDEMLSNKYEYYFDGVAGPYGISSTTEDLFKWDQALYTEKLVSKEALSRAYQPSQLINGKNAKLGGLAYGFGWLIMPNRHFSGKWYMHTGGYPGYASIIVRYPEKNKTVIVLSNSYNVISMYHLAESIENILFDKPFTIPKIMRFRKSAVLAPAQIKVLEGEYSLAMLPGKKFSITFNQGQVYAQLTGQAKVEIYPESETKFFYTAVAEL